MSARAGISGRDVQAHDARQFLARGATSRRLYGVLARCALRSSASAARRCGSAMRSSLNLM